MDDRFRHTVPDETTAERHHRIYEAGEAFFGVIMEVCGDSRERSLAVTKAEEAAMWANKAVARTK